MPYPSASAPGAAWLAGAVAVAVGGIAIDVMQRAATTRARAEQRASALAALLAALAATHRITALGGGHATVVSSAVQDRAAFVHKDLPKLSDSHLSELWYAHDGKMQPAGLIGPGNGPGTALLTGSVSGADGAGLTVKPYGGSEQPMTSPLMLVPIAG